MGDGQSRRYDLLLEVLCDERVRSQACEWSLCGRMAYGEISPQSLDGNSLGSRLVPEQYDSNRYGHVGHYGTV